ncbi:MAG: DEAD/DEAH box helicase, partial [Flavobacteriales bacterium]|nr:DEAD/DEAH box helicase [Flavobacteriales bacterium]
PPNEEDYVHRIGRTARADKDGEGVTLVNPDDQHRFMRIEKLIEKVVPKLEIPERLGKGPEYNGARDRSRGPGGGGNRSGGGGNRKGGQGGKSGGNYRGGGGGGKSQGGGYNRSNSSKSN